MLNFYTHSFKVFIYGSSILLCIAFCSLQHHARAFSSEHAKNKPQITISGTITDSASGRALPGANVRVKGGTTGATTNAKGQYRLVVNSLQDTLIFSYLGYIKKTIPINGRTTIDVGLVARTFTQSEVVVIGYGTKKKSHLTEAVSTVSGEELMKSAAMNVGNMLAGKTTGLQIIQPSGLPGGNKPRIYLRGVHTLGGGDKRPNQQGSSQPIFIVDGVKRDIFQIEPNNIKSISILKDAAATAIYGIEGANGVIVVTTKRGHKGPARISLRLSAGMQQPANLPEMIGSYQYAKLFNEAQIWDGIDPANVRFSEEALQAFKTGKYPLIYPNTDWIGQIMKPAAFMTRNSISISGGTNKVLYYVSGGYLNQQGLFRTFGLKDNLNPSFQKYNFRSNLDINITSTTKISLSGYGRLEKRRRTNAQGNLWKNIYLGAPFAGAGIVDGKIVTSGYGENNKYISCCKFDPMLRIYGNGFKLHFKNVFNIDLAVKQKLNFITKGLSFQFKGSYNSSFIQNRIRGRAFPHYLPYFKVDVDPNVQPGDPGDSSIVYKKEGFHGTLAYNENYQRDQHWYMEARVHYNRRFGPHHVSGLILANQRKDYYPQGDYRSIPRKLVGLVGRMDYSYDNRYLLQFNMGYNGSENFAKGRRFGFFPSVSGGWILTNESFMKPVRFIDHLKLTASYGIVGNDQGVGRFLYLPTTYQFAGSGYNFGYLVPQNTGSARIGALGNPDVSWETSHQQNYAIDLKVLRNKLSLHVDYFREYRTNILTKHNTLPIFVTSHLDLPAVNIGEVKNHGYEATVKWQQAVGDDFFYHLGAHVTFARNKIVYKDEVPRKVPWLRRTGQPVGQPFGYVFDGFFTEEILKDPNSGVPKQPYPVRAGDFMFRDLNGDGIINSLDKRPIGYPKYPEYVFGATIGFQYKNFDLSTNWMGATHVSRILQYNPFRMAFGPVGQGGEWATFKWQVADAWKPGDGHAPDTKYPFPRLSTKNSRHYNGGMDADVWTKDASYVRLKNAQIGYSFSPDLLKRIGLKKLRVYVSGYDLLTFSPLKHYSLDPEADTKAGRSDYPVVKIYKMGIDVTF